MAATRRICPECRRVMPKHLRKDFFNGRNPCGYCGFYVPQENKPTRVGEWGGD